MKVNIYKETTIIHYGENLPYVPTIGTAITIGNNNYSVITSQLYRGKFDENYEIRVFVQDLD